MESSLSKQEIIKSVTFFEKKFGRAYDLRIHNPENILPGKAIYAANHFHHFDPIFVLYAIAKFKEKLAHQLAKPSLFKMPFIGSALKKYKAIITPRPAKGEELSFDDYERLKDEITNTLEMDEPLSYAYAGGMTNNFALDDESRENEKLVANSGLLTLTRKVKGLKIIPVAVDTYQRRSKKLLFNAVTMLSGISSILPAPKTHAVDLMFGTPVDIDTFLQQKSETENKVNRRQQLVEYVVDKVYQMRHKISSLNKDNPHRCITKYFK